jgi:hypothetical protein
MRSAFSRDYTLWDDFRQTAVVVPLCVSCVVTLREDEEDALPA